MKIALISTIPNKNTLWEDEFTKPIYNEIVKNSHKVDIIHFRELKNLEKYDKIIIAGSPLGDFKAHNNLEKFDWIKTIDKPLLGICAGMQIIGETFGAKLYDSLEIGLSTIIVDRSFALCEKGEIQAYQLHAKNVEPNNLFEELAYNNQGTQIIKHKNKDIYGVLFHPEVRNPEIIRNFLNL